MKGKVQAGVSAAVSARVLSWVVGWSLLAGSNPAPAQAPIFLGKVVPLPTNVAEIFSPAAGRILSPRERPYTVGERVEKATPLAIIEHRYNLHDAAHLTTVRWDLLQVMLETRYAALAARVEREKAERLLRLGSVSGQKVQELHAAEEVAKAEYEKRRNLLAQQDQQIGNTTLVRRSLPAPIEGEISLANFTQGQMVYEGYLLYRIVNRQEVGVMARVPEAEYRPWPATTAAKIRFEGLPGKEFAGRLEVTPPAVDPQSRTRDVLFRVKNPGDVLRFGMIGQVEVQAP